MPQVSVDGATTYPVVALAVADPRQKLGTPWSTALRWKPHYS